MGLAALAVLVALAAMPSATLAASRANGVIAYSQVELDEGPCDGCEEEAPADQQSWIELVRPDGSARKRFPCTTGSFATCDDRGPAFSPGGRRLAIVNGDEIVIARLNGAVTRRIPIRAISVAWSPDGRRLAYTDSYEDPTAPTPWVRHAVYVIRLADPASRTTVARDVFPFGLSWSSRGLLAWEKIGPRRGIYVGGSRGERRRRVVPTYSTAHLPSWSPDGRQLAYACGRDLWLCAVRPDGSGKRVLSRRCDMSWDPGGGMAWSPDGREVVCTSRRSGKLLVLEPGRAPRRIATGQRNFLPFEIAWQPRPASAQ